jgi:hypothetical protein
MVVLGDVQRGMGFTAWQTSLDESMERIRDVYVKNFQDENTWMWFCWLDATQEGERVARALSKSQESAGNS